MPHWVKFSMVQSSTVRLPPVIILMALKPELTPLKSSPFRRTLSVDAMLTTMPLVPETSSPPITPLQMMLIDLVMVTAPKPPESRQSISPAGAVLEIAPAKVLHGAVRLQGLASSPTPETQVRVACAWAGAEANNGRNNPTARASKPKRRMVH